MKNRIAITFALAALAVGVLAGQAASKAGSAQLSPGGTWQDVAPLPQTLFGPATATDGTYVYAFGGYHFPENIGSTLNTVYRYNPATDTWTTLAPMPQPSLIASAVYYPPTNKIYVFGGSDRDLQIVFDLTQIYDIATNTWSMGAPMPAPRSQMARGYNSADGKIYVNGGYETAFIENNLCGQLPIRVGKGSKDEPEFRFRIMNGDKEERVYRLIETVVRRVREPGESSGKRAAVRHAKPATR